jgi:hypothetical protein
MQSNEFFKFSYNNIGQISLASIGDVAQMVERSLSMREVRGSIPCISTIDSFYGFLDFYVSWFSFYYLVSLFCLAIAFVVQSLSLLWTQVTVFN